MSNNKPWEEFSITPVESSEPWNDYEPTDEPAKDRGFTGALIDGAKSTGRAISSTYNTYTGDSQAVVDNSKEQELANEDKSQDIKNFQSDFAANTGVGTDDEVGLWGAIKGTGKAIIDNPRGAALSVVEQFPNSVPTLAAGWAGAKGGAMAGGAVGSAFGGVGAGPGALIGGAAGFVGGMFLGNTLTETGHKAQEYATDGEFTPDEQSAAMTEGAKKAGAITAVDALTFGIGGKISSTMRRTAENAVEAATRKTLIDAGVDISDATAVSAARSSQQLAKSVSEAQQNAAKIADSLRKRAAEAGVLLTVETIGEGLGEYLGELAATGQASVSEAVLESFLSLGQSSVQSMFNFAKAREKSLTEQEWIDASNGIAPEGMAPEQMPVADGIWDKPTPEAKIDMGQMQEGGVTPTPVFDQQDIDRNLAPTPSQQMGINPDAGPLSAAAAQSVDSGLFTGGFTPQAGINQSALEREGVSPPPVLDADQIDRNLGSIDPITGEYMPAPELLDQPNQAVSTGNYEYDRYGNLSKVDGRTVEGYGQNQPRLGFNNKAERSTAPLYEVGPDGVARPSSGEAARSRKERIDLSTLEGRQQTQAQKQPAAMPEQRTPEKSAQHSWDSMNTFERNAAAANVLGMRGVPAKNAATKAWDKLSSQQQAKLVTGLESQQGKRWIDPNQKVTDQTGPVLQNRDRTSQDSINQMRSISNNPDYSRLKTSGFLSDGAPVVVDENIQIPASQMGVTDTASAGNERFNVQYAVVEADQLMTSNSIDGTTNAEYQTGAAGKARAIAGNGRITGLQSAWAKGNASQYKADMAADRMHGIDPAVIEGMRNPILVRLLPQDQVTDNIGDLSNRDEKGRLSPVEQAKTDMGRIDLDSLKFTADGAIGGEAIHQFRMAQPAAERVTEAEARKRLTSAIFQKAYGNDQLTEIQSGESDDAKSILSALAQAAPSMSRLEGAGEFDIRPLITQAGIAAVNAARRGTKLADYVQQSEMGIDPMVYPILEMMLNENGNIRSSKYIGEQLTNMAKLAYDEANSPSSDMFGEKPKRTAEQVIQDALTGVQGYGQINDGRGQESLGQRGRSEPDAQMVEGPEGGRERPADTRQTAPTQPEPTRKQPETEVTAKPISLDFTDTSVRVYGDVDTIRQRLRAEGINFPGAEIDGGLSFGKKLESKIKAVFSEDLDQEAMTDMADDTPIEIVPSEAVEQAVESKPETWRSNYIQAAKIAREKGIDPKQHKKLADLVAAIDSSNTKPEAQTQLPAQQKQASGSVDGAKVHLNNSIDLTSALAAIARGAQLSTEPNGDVILSGTKIITLPKQPTSVDEVIGALAVALRDQMRADGVSMPGNPAEMTRDQFVVAYEFANIIPEFEITGEDIGGVVQGSNSGLTVDADKLYDKIVEQTKGQSKSKTKENPTKPNSSKVKLEASKTTMDEWVESEIENSKYADAYRDDPQARKGKVKQLEDQWRKAVVEAAKDGRIQTEVLDDFVSREGETGLLRTFRGEYEAGIKGYDLPSVRSWDKTYAQYMAQMTAADKMMGKGSHKSDHARIVRDAIARGEPVPDNVRKQVEGQQEAQAPDLDLTQQTEETLAADAERLEQLQKEEAAQKAKQKAAESKARERDADKARADEVLDDFQLGQQAEDAMSGMDDIFATESKPKVEPTKTPLQSLNEAIDSIIEEQRAIAEDWKNREYKDAKGSVQFEGDGPSTKGSMSINAINEGRRRKAIEQASNSIAAAKKLKDSASEGSGEKLLNQMALIYNKPIAGNDSPTTAEKDAMFEARFLRSIDFDGKQSGATQSNSISKAMLVAVKEHIKTKAIDKQKQIAAEAKLQKDFEADTRSADEVIDDFFEGNINKPSKPSKPAVELDGDQNADALVKSGDTAKRNIGKAYQRAQSQGPINTSEAKALRKFYSGEKGAAELESLIAEHGEKSLSDAMQAVIDKGLGRDTAKAEQAKPNQAVEDYGEKMAGAIKDQPISSLSKNLTDEEMASQPLSALWPVNEPLSIEDNFAAAFSYAARQNIPAKPRLKYKVKRWVDAVKSMREIAKAVQDGEITKDNIGALSKTNDTSSSLAAKANLLSGLDRKHWSRIGRVDVSDNAYIFDENRNKVPSPHTVIVVDGRSVLVKGKYDNDSVTAVIKASLEMAEQSDASKRGQFEIRQNRNTDEIFINRKGDKEYRKLKTFPKGSVKEARDFVNNNTDELVAEWEAIKERDNVTKADVRSDTNKERTGIDYRNGKDVTSEEFAETFGFRGVEFGNWVSQGKGQKDRQGMLNAAYDALLDLAAVVGIPPKAVSLNSSLGIAFGSRGKGKASAHYETDNIVINLTKTKGAGSLAHEWFHALDNYFSRRRGVTPFDGNQTAYNKANYITYKPEPMMALKTSLNKKGLRPHLITKAEYDRRAKSGVNFDADNWTPDTNHPIGVRPVVEKAFAELVSELDKSPMLKRSETIDKGKVDGYWSSIIERAARSFESYVIQRLEDQGISNQYLANVVTLENFKRDEGRYPYLTNEELKPVAEKFDTLFSTIETREEKRGNFLMFSRNNNQPNNPTTNASLLKNINDSYPALTDSVVTMLQRGRKGQKGGLVIVDSNNGADIAKAYSEATGMPIAQANRLFSDGESINGFYDTKSGITFLVGPNLDATTAPAVLLHEVTHSQQRSEIDARSMKLINGRAKEKNADLKAFLETVSQRMIDAGEYGNPLESTTYIVEQAIIEGRSQGYTLADSKFFNAIEKTLGATVASIVRDFTKMVRQFALRRGLPINITLDDLVQYAMASVEQAAKGNIATENKGGMAYSFAGEDALTADLASLAEAKKQIATDLTPDQVRKNTGWMQGAEGRWRFEIDDSKASFVDAPMLDSYLAGTLTGEKKLNAADQKALNLLKLKERKMSAEVFGAKDKETEAWDQLFYEWHQVKQQIQTLERRASGEFMNVGSLLKHDQLLNAYPGMKNIKIRLAVDDSVTMNGFYDRKNNIIEMTAPNKEKLMAGLLHELQHAIQSIEGFARGGSPSQFDYKDATSEYLDRVSNKIIDLLNSNKEFGATVRKVKQEFTKLSNKYPLVTKDGQESVNWDKVPTDESEAYFKLLDETEKHPEVERWHDLETEYRIARRDGKTLTPFEQYQSLAGEVEARNVESRWYFTEEERKEFSPIASEDFQRQDQIIRYSKAQTKTPAFKKWFGDSKVVDANGEPLVVYHGTNADIFKFELASGHGGKVDVAFFTSSAEVASDYANNALFPRNVSEANKEITRIHNSVGDWLFSDEYFSALEAADNARANPSEHGANVLPVYLSMLNPLIVEAINGRAAHNKTQREMIDSAYQDGYDGVIIRNGMDGLQDARNVVMDSYIIFDNKQVKSAIGNNGNFDPANPDIRYSKKQAYNPNQGDLFAELEKISNDDPYAKTKQRPGTTERQRELGRSALRDFFGWLKNSSRAGGNKAGAGSGEVSLLGASIYKDFQAGKPYQLIGQTIESPKDLAALAQVYRDPRFETFRAFFVDKDGKIILEQTASTRMPASISFSDDLYMELNRSLENSGADKFYIMHNHPSGVPTPSEPDIAMTKYMGKAFGKRMAAHVVIDHNSYAVIDENGNVTEHQDERLAGIDFSSNPEVDHASLNKQINSPDQMALVAKQVANSDTPILVVTKAGAVSRVGLIASVPMELLNKGNSDKRDTKFTAAVRRMIRAAGAGGALFVVLPKSYGTKGEGYHFEHGSLQWMHEFAQDVVDSDGNSVIFVRHQVSIDDYASVSIKDGRTSKQAAIMREEAGAFNGSYGLNEPNIQFSRAANPASTGAAPNGMAAWDSPSASKFDDFVYKMQDKHVDTKRVIEAIRDTGKAISDDLDVYLQETLFHGRAAKRTQDFLNKEVNPLIEYMQSAKVEMSDLEEFLHARHAQEANALIAKRDPNMPDGGSGMTNAEAAKYLNSLNGVRRKQLENAAKFVDKIIGGTRETIVNYGLESQETVDGWTAGFKHYIPLQREDKDGQMGIGQGFSVKGKETKGRTGSTRKVVDILANVMMQRERAIVRGEKNRVAVALLGLAKDNPLPEFWQVDKVPTTRVLDKVTGLVRNQADPMYRSRDNAIVAKVNGQEHAILMNEDDPRAMRMAEALKNLDAAQLEGLLGATATATRYFAAVNTQYNPIFGVTNFVRDIQEAMLHLQSTPLAGQQARLFKNTFTAVGAVMKAERDGRKGNNATGKWGVLWEDFQNTGGQTGFRDQFSSSADRGDAIKNALTPGGWADTGLGKLFTAGGVLKVPLEVARKKAAWLFDLLSDYNTAMENGVRLSAYETGINAGMSKEQAAALAKGLTVNFNRKGQVTQQVGALYAFFNASVQGTARLGQSLFDMDAGKPKTLRLSSLGKKIVSGGVMLGASQAVLLAMAGFDDEEPPEFIRERNIIIPTGGKTYISIPMPLGYHVIANLGRIPMEFVLGGGKDGAKYLFNLMDVMADIYNPIGNSGLSMQTIAPTVLDPLAGLAENKDFSGRAIAKESFNRHTPGHALARDAASLPATWLAELVNYATGGTEFTRGELSPTPDQIDYLVGQLTGGVGRETTKFMKSIQATATGDDLPWHNIPLAGRFFGDADSDGAKQSAFYNNMDKVRKHAEEVKGLRAAGRTSEAIEYANKHPQAKLHLAARAAEKQVKDMRDRKRDLEQAGAPREEIRALEKRMVQRMEQFVELAKAQ